MAPLRHTHCNVCSSQDSKYSCPSCLIPYCSVKCFKDHKANTCSSPALVRASPAAAAEVEPQLRPEDEVPDALTLKPLISLKWPYIPEVPSYADPLKRDEPKPLQLHQYKAIATSPAIRSALSSNPSLPAVLRKLDKLRGVEREEALERLLGITTDSPASHGRRTSPRIEPDDVKAMKQLAEAVEKAVRGEKDHTLGLDWAEDN